MTNEEFIASVSLENEKWKEIPSWEGYYAASNLGRILSLGRYVNGRYSLAWKKPKIMKQTKMKQTGYLVVNLSRNNNRGQLHLIHRLVAITFIPNPHNYTCIDHIDTNRNNNKVDNLRWCTYNGNMRNNKTLNHLHSMPKTRRMSGYSYHVLSLNDGKIYRTYASISSVKNEGHDPKSVWLVCVGRRKHHHGFKWMFLSDYEKSLVTQ